MEDSSRSLIVITPTKMNAKSTRISGGCIRRNSAQLWMFVLSLLLLSIQFDVVGSSTPNFTECNLNCPAGIECVIGKVNHLASIFNSTTDNNVDTTDTDELSWNGMHCNCPPGKTGVMCEVEFDSCSSTGSNSHVCYNGGQCIQGITDYFGNEQMFCDCTTAMDTTNDLIYVGKYCEHAVVLSPDDLADDDSSPTPGSGGGGDSGGNNSATPPVNSTTTDAEDTIRLCQENPEVFCLNGGSCNLNYA